MSLPGLAVRYRAFRLPRQGYAPDECQDACAGAPEAGRFAIADGAAESPHAALWARLLVEDFVLRSERQPAWSSWLPSLQDRWVAAVERSADTPPVPWFLEPGLSQGAFATFLGLVIEDTTWHALAVGDSCLFQVRDGSVRRAFPIVRAAEFSNAPWLVGSRTSPNGVPRANGHQHQGDWKPADRFWLMTDALAQWFLVQVEAGNKPWLALEPLLRSPAADANEAFAAWIKNLRGSRELRNDDVTLMAVSL
jgi:hypothetical protein